MVRYRGIAARAGRWSARHRKTAIAGWLVFVLASLALGSAIGTVKLANDQGERAVPAQLTPSCIESSASPPRSRC